MAIRISRYGKEIDEIEEYQLSRLADSGQLQPTDLAWKEGMEEWKPLNILFPDLFREDPPPVSTPQRQSQPPSIPPPPPLEDPINQSGDTISPPVTEIETLSKPPPWHSKETDNPAVESASPSQLSESAIEPVEFIPEENIQPNLPPFTTVSIFDHEQIAMFKPGINDKEIVEILENKITEFSDKWPSEITAQYLSDRGHCLFVPYLICRGEGSARWFAQVAVFGQTDSKGKTTMTTESREGASSLRFTQTVPNWEDGAINHKIDIDWKQGERIVVPKVAAANLEVV